MTRPTQLAAVSASYDQTAAEISAGVTPTNYGYPPGDVRRYGADPTGVSDSTTAIQNAINANAPVGKSVFIPAGKYAITTLTLPQQAGGIEIYGEAYDSVNNLATSVYRGSVLVSSATAGNVISCDGGGSYTNRGIRIRNLNIKTATTGYAIYLKGCPEEAIIDCVNVYCTSASSGCGIGLQSCWGAKVTNTQITNATISGTTSRGLYIFNDIDAGEFEADTVNISGFYQNVYIGEFAYQNIFTNCSFDTGTYGFYINGAYSQATLLNCHLEYNTDIAVYAAKSNALVIQSSSFYRNAETASGTKAEVYFATGGSNYNATVSIRNNLWQGVGTGVAAIYVANSAFAWGEIDNNQFTGFGTGTYGVYFATSDNRQWRVTQNSMFSITTQYTPYPSLGVKQFATAQSGTLQIRFDPTPVQSTDTTTLDLYARGTFTPSVTGSGGGTPTITAQYGTYQVVGHAVTFQASVTWSAMSGSSGNIQLTGLPYTAANIGSGTFPVAMYGNVPTSAGLQIMAVVIPNATYVGFYAYNPATGAITNVGVPATGTLTICGSYII